MLVVVSPILSIIIISITSGFSNQTREKEKEREIKQIFIFCVYIFGSACDFWTVSKLKNQLLLILPVTHLN